MRLIGCYWFILYKIFINCLGVFEFISIWVIGKAQSRIKLFFAVAGLAGTLTLFTSNDIVILTLTPILCSVANLTHINPIPFLICQFFMANIWSIALLIGNPTNIIVAQAENFGFVDYSKWMALPAVACGFSCLAIIYSRFRGHLSEKIDIPKKNPNEFLRDKNGAIFGLVSLVLCLGLLLVSSATPIPLWLITVIFGGLLLLKDMYRDISRGPSFPIQKRSKS